MRPTCSTQVHHSCLPAPSSALSSPFNTFPALQHISNFHAILATCTPLYPLATVHRYLPPSRATQCTRYHHPPASCRLLPEFHVPLASAGSAKDAINWYKIHSTVS
ncbi:hypothetical protein M405DRAFT_812445 [Rhizopogon salebrosus TDB-379]|nr:hypothetical protein M405DRAFT_812445 [Rhizopogon salebrosus TDB-379]